jgi:4-deoxy-L-threo-5-hexosulose-uronate ketol-isomerase
MIVMDASYTSRNAIDPKAAAAMDTAGLRENFLLEDLFRPGKITLVYAHYDRMIVGGAVPESAPLALDAIKPTGTSGFLDRRELAIFNIGAHGIVNVDGQSHALDHRDMIYVGMGAGDLSFASTDPSDPARFYLISAPAHRTCPTAKVQIGDARRIDLGSTETCNERSIFQFVHPEGIKTCQLVVGMTMIANGSNWNTMPAHVHDRRSEVYLYFDLPDTARVFHMMGEPSETRHLLVANEQAVLSPQWSIHCGAGTANYTFIWAMAGDNIDYTDIDPVAIGNLR